MKDEQGLVTFPQFVRLVAQVMKTHRWWMDRHIEPQVRGGVGTSHVPRGGDGDRRGGHLSFV